MTGQQPPQRDPMQGCGSCTACCKVMKVRELDKPADTWCAHCAIGAGCRIYDTRPESCRVYECVWLRTQALDRPLAPTLRPDRSRVVIGTVNDGEDIILYVSPDRPDAWKRPEFMQLIGEFRGRGVRVLLSCNDRVVALPA